MLNNKNTKRLAVLFLTGFVLTKTTACNQNEKVEIEKIDIIDSTEDLENDLKAIEILETEEVIVDEIITEIEMDLKENREEPFEKIQDTEEIKQSPDEIINYYLEEENEKIKQIIDSDDIDKIKETITSSFITLVDFIYYGETIYGITYEELSDATKQNVKETFELIDTIIDHCFPNYKETLSSKYQEIKEKGTSILYEKLGEDNWNHLKDAKDSFKDSLEDTKDVVDDLTESGKTKVKTWYEEFKINHP